MADMVQDLDVHLNVMVMQTKSVVGNGASVFTGVSIYL